MATLSGYQGRPPHYYRTVLHEDGLSVGHPILARLLIRSPSGGQRRTLVCPAAPEGGWRSAPNGGGSGRLIVGGGRAIPAEPESYLTPEARARREIDRRLQAAGWAVQDADKVNLARREGCGRSARRALDGLFLSR